MSSSIQLVAEDCAERGRVARICCAPGPLGHSLPLGAEDAVGTRITNRHIGDRTSRNDSAIVEEVMDYRTIAKLLLGYCENLLLR